MSSTTTSDGELATGDFVATSGGWCFPMLSNGLDTRAYAEDCQQGTTCGENTCGYPTKEACLESCLSRYGGALRCAEWANPETCCCQYTHGIKAHAFPDNFCWYPSATSTTYVLNGCSPEACPTVCRDIDATCNQAVSGPRAAAASDLTYPDASSLVGFTRLSGGWCFPLSSDGSDARVYAEHCGIGTACNNEGGCGFPNEGLCFASCLSRYGSNLQCAEFYGPTWCCCQFAHAAKALSFPENFCWFPTAGSVTYVRDGSKPAACPNVCKNVHSTCDQMVSSATALARSSTALVFMHRARVLMFVGIVVVYF